MISFQKTSQRGCETALYSLVTVRSQTGSLYRHAGGKPGDSPDVARCQRLLYNNVKIYNKWLCWHSSHVDRTKHWELHSLQVLPLQRLVFLSHVFNVPVADSAVTREDDVWTQRFTVAVTPAASQPCQQPGAGTVQPDWNRPSYSPYRGPMPKICVQSSSGHQMEDGKADLGSAAASLESWHRTRRRKKVWLARRQTEPYVPSGELLCHYRRVWGLFTLIFFIWARTVLWAADVWPELQRGHGTTIWTSHSLLIDATVILWDRLYFGLNFKHQALSSSHSH